MIAGGLTAQVGSFSLKIGSRLVLYYRVAQKSKLLYCVNSLLFWATLYIHQMNQVNSRSDFIMMATP